MNGTCKAAVWTDAGKIEVWDVQLPECQDDGMIIKLDATSICGTDLHTYVQKPNVPAILGHEICGTIVEMGKHANETIKCFSGEVKVGDRIVLYPWVTCGTCPSCLRYGAGTSGLCKDSFVYGLPYDMLGLSGSAKMSASVEEAPFVKGGFSEYLYIFPGTYVWRLPKEMPSRIGSLLDPLAVAVRTVELAQRAPGVFENSFNENSTVLVNGDGAVGILTAMVARNLGVKNVLISGGRDERLSVAKHISDADCLMNYHKQSLEERKEIVNTYTDGRGADVIFQCAGTPQAFRDAIEFLSGVGTFIETGNIAEAAPVSFDPARDLCSKHATYIGMSVNTPQAFNKAFNILTKWEKYDLGAIQTHRCTLDTLQETMDRSKEPSYIKGWVDFCKKSS